MQEDEVEMTNYIVPFDYDSSRFTWVEFLSDKERNICVYHFDTKTKWSHPINKSFGHISHCKFLPNDKILIVRDLTKVEIRKLDDSFKIVHEFTNIGDEVISVDVYYNNSKYLMNDDVENVQVGRNNDHVLKVQKDEEELPPSEENISVILLDIDGNVNVWENLNISKKFNLYQIPEISSEHKKKQFFSMGYPYFIKANMNFYAISTDHGVFVIKKE
jgi:hypothetical protein